MNDSPDSGHGSRVEPATDGGGAPHPPLDTLPRGPALGSAALVCLRRSAANLRLAAHTEPAHRDAAKRMLNGFATEIEWAVEVLTRIVVERSVAQETYQRALGALEDLASCQPEANPDEWKRAQSVAYGLLYGPPNTEREATPRKGSE